MSQQQPFVVNADFARNYMIIETFAVFNKPFYTILYYKNEN